ncbi:hypothetical protein [Chitinophaga solisilvae]|uniref:Uncharacterized protein n=1 Tax=Chitinophaga solisilvae TaxID=1233460 RepID=A0A9Q5DAH9_9BACT|nr:hypothetical protein [Chitinophaga solisilvae]NSL89575.1 hypothetical protein [Chitinophaga solisilvae]
MKHQLNFKSPLAVAAVIALSVCTNACQSDFNTPIISCPNMSMSATLENTTRSMQLSTNTIFRQQIDSGGAKYLSLEAVSDSIRIVINVVDGVYPDHKLADDSLRLKTYIFSRAAKLQGGLVAGAVKTGQEDYRYLTTDTSSVTITRVNTKLKTVTGTFYFEASNRTVKGSGVFVSACYVSLP